MRPSFATRSAAFALGIFGMLCLAGCNDTGMVPAAGKIVYTDGSNIEGPIRVVQFAPIADNVLGTQKAASSRIAEDGSFELMTKRPGDGVIKGKYAVTFSVLSDPTNPDSLLIPEKYSWQDKTPFEVEVTEAKDDYLFELEKK